MPTREHFSSQELDEVQSHYDIGPVHYAKPLSAGNRRVPKMIITSNQGKFLLKRRPKAKDVLQRVAFAHAVQNDLAQVAFPVTSLMTTRDHKTILQLGNHIYECFRFVPGLRYDGSAAATIDAGRQLANLHGYLADFACEYEPPTGSFHDSSIVRNCLEKVADQQKTSPDARLQETIQALTTLYNNSAASVIRLGFHYWPNHVVHGDWHPGNMLFADQKLIAVLDFDSTRLAPLVTDVANGVLQFSIVTGSPNPADWPEYINQAKLIQFLYGYLEIIELDRNELRSLPALMIEAMIAEAIVPIAVTGSFGQSTAGDFLKMVLRKAQWLNKNREKLTEAMQG
ncbi:MAG: phosphotransferase enzyme family protein [Planctomycetota bacterium]|jgi:Ser/Thr protein kinase RdoA (MazF antagonist)